MSGRAGRPFLQILTWKDCRGTVVYESFRLSVRHELNTFLEVVFFFFFLIMWDGCVKFWT